jgi:prepilin-type N-terminal cleavage/methylation domain-containing protein
MKNARNEKGFTLIELMIVIIIIGGGIGWVMNLVKLADTDFEEPYKTEIIRTISLVPFIGAFTGYMNIGEETENKE